MEDREPTNLSLKAMTPPARVAPLEDNKPALPGTPTTARERSAGVDSRKSVLPDDGMVDTAETVQLVVAGNKNAAKNRDLEAALSGASSAPQASKGNMKMTFFDYNLHATKKMVSSALLDVALLMANASQLKSVYMQGSDHAFYEGMMTMLITSIILQVGAGVVMIVLSRININEPDEQAQKVAEGLNTTIIIVVFLLTVINIFISALGISSAPKVKYITATTSNP